MSSEKSNVEPQVPHGVCRADDPNREADQRAGSSTASPQATAPSASAEARGVAPSVSDDSAGTRIPAGSAPSRVDKEREGVALDTNPTDATSLGLPPIKGYVNMPYRDEPGMRVIGFKVRLDDWAKWQNEGDYLHLPIEWLMKKLKGEPSRFTNDQSDAVLLVRHAIAGKACVFEQRKGYWSGEQVAEELRVWVDELDEALARSSTSFSPLAEKCGIYDNILRDMPFPIGDVGSMVTEEWKEWDKRRQKALAGTSSASSNLKPTRDELKAIFPLLWHINDHLRITPDQGVEYTGSTNDVDNLRERLHKLDPNFDLGTAHEGMEAADVEAAIRAADRNGSAGG